MDERPVHNLYTGFLYEGGLLNLQVCSHLKAAAQETSIRVVAIVGGMAVPKQQRLLRARPAIVVGTPGRLWELISQGEQHLLQVGYVCG